MNATSATQPTDWVPDAPAAVPVTRVDDSRVAAFIAAHKLEGYVEAAVQLAREAFPKAKRMTLSMFGAPGEYGERLIVDVATGVGVHESLRQYDDFVNRWIATTPPWVTDLMGISTDLS